MNRAIEVFILILMVGFLVGWLAASLYFGPLKNAMARIRETLALGNGKQRIPVKSKRREVQEIVSLVNQMLEKNTFLAQQLSGAFDNVAHDLRTPVTRLRATAEEALEKQSDAEACREALADCLEESERVLQILNTLMDVAEAESGGLRLKCEKHVLFELVQDVVEMYEEVAEEKEVKVENRVPKNIECAADKVRLQQAIANLLDNAVKYNRKGGWVHFNAEEKGNAILLSVGDNGSGIAPFELEKIWKRLYRSDRSRSEKGLGLGLSFVKAIIEAHKGKVWVESCLGEGAVFYLELPIGSQ